MWKILLKNIILSTTFGDSVSSELGVERERELCGGPGLWGDMLKCGSKVVRITRQPEDDINLLQMLAKKVEVTLRIQDEMVRQRSHAWDCSCWEKKI
jgi:hypothetical protein